MKDSDPKTPPTPSDAPAGSLPHSVRQPGSLKHNVRSSSTHIAAAQLAGKALGFFVSLYIFRYFSMDNQGRYSWFIGIAVYFQYFSNLGLHESLQRFVPEYFARHEYPRILRTYKICASLVFSLSIAAFGLVAYFYQPFASFFQMAEHRDVFIAFAASIVLYLQYITLGIILNSLFLHRYQVWGQTAYSAIKAVGLFLFLRAGYGLKGVFLADICGYAPVFFVLLFLFWRWMRQRLLRGSYDEAAAIETGRIARYSALNTLYTPGALMFGYSTDYLVLNHYSSTAAAGLYSFATRASQTLLQVLPQKMVESVIRPTFYVRYASTEDKRPALHEMFNSLCRLNLFFLMPMLVFIVLAGTTFIPLVFGRQYIDSVYNLSGVQIPQGYLLLVFTFAFICGSFYELPTDLVIQSVEKIKYRSIAQVFGLLNLALDILVVKIGYGIMGVVFATGISIVIRNLFVLHYARKFSGIRFEWQSYIRIAINTAAMGVVVYTVLAVLHNTIGLILACLLGGSVYLAMTVFHSPFTEKEQGQFLFLARLRKW